GEPRAVALGQPAARRRPGLEPAELDPQQGGLQLVEAAVAADARVLVALLAGLAAGVAQHGAGVVERLAAGDERAGVAGGAQVLRGVEGEAAGVAVRPDRAAAIGREVGL